jgi:Zn-dependent protease with chaperone function
MVSQQNPLQAASLAIRQKHFPEAIRILEAFCQQQAKSPSNDYFQAQIWLAKAYQQTGQVELAIALCRRLSLSSPPQVQAWARQTLTTLSPAPAADADDTPTLLDNAVPLTATPEPPAPASEEPPAAPNLSPEEAADLLNQGNKALKMGRFAEAVEILETYYQGADPDGKDYGQAQTLLVKAYKGNEQIDEAIALCQQLTHHEKPFIKIWADKFLLQLGVKPTPPESESVPEPAAPEQGGGRQGHRSVGQFNGQPEQPEVPRVMPKAGRAARGLVSLSMKGVAGSLALASGVTISLLAGMVLVLSLSLVLIQGSDNPLVGLVVAIALTIAFNVAVFFIAPFIMDLVQKILYGTRWVSLAEVKRQSPEAAQIITTICREKKLNPPRLGIINDQNPTAFTYGSLPNSARLVVSQGLFTYLDDDEVATVYAHELGHIVHWDFAVMTVAATLVQVVFLLYVAAREMAYRLGDSDGVKQFKNGLQAIALAAYIFYVVGEYLVLYLSRTREYYADHFAAETTGNPNALSRALVKIAYGIMEAGERSSAPSRVLQGTRSLGISDPGTANFMGTAYRVAAEPAQVGRVFLWDMFNPWGWWMELGSTHPLTGKRIRALSTYAEQLGLDAEFDMARVIKEGRRLSKKKLYGHFAFDLILYRLEWLLAGLGLLLGLVLTIAVHSALGLTILAFALIGFGLGTLIKVFITYPDYHRVGTTDVLTLMSDPYASPLRGRPVKLVGQVIGRADAGNRLGSDLKLQDQTGMILLRFASRFGPLGNLLFGMGQADAFINRQVTVVGWFRRGTMPWVNFLRMDCPEKWTCRSYPRFWSIILGVGTIALGFAIPAWLMKLVLYGV